MNTNVRVIKTDYTDRRRLRETLIYVYFEFLLWPMSYLITLILGPIPQPATRGWLFAETYRAWLGRGGNIKSVSFSSLRGDLSPDEVVRLVNEGLREGERAFNIKARSILCCIRPMPCNELFTLLSAKTTLWDKAPDCIVFCRVSDPAVLISYWARAPQKDTAHSGSFIHHWPTSFQSWALTHAEADGRLSGRYWTISEPSALVEITIFKVLLRLWTSLNVFGMFKFRPSDGFWTIPSDRM